jgi:hypothetical protein
MEPITSITLLLVIAGVIGTVRMHSLDAEERENLADAEFKAGYEYGFQEGHVVGYHLGGDEEMKRWLDLDDENARLRGIIGDLRANLAELNGSGCIDECHCKGCTGACQRVGS